MTWLPFKAKPNARKNLVQKKKTEIPRYCRICGQQVASGHYCQTCKDFISQKRTEERGNA